MGLSKAFFQELQPEFTDEDLDYMRYLLEQSSYDYPQREKILSDINMETDIEELERIKEDLYRNNLGIHGAVNPNQGEINRHLKKFL